MRGIFPPLAEVEAGTCCRLIPYKCVWLFADCIFQTKLWYGACARQPCNPSSKQAVICLFKKLAWNASFSPHGCANTHPRSRAHTSERPTGTGSSVWVAPSSACSSAFLFLKWGVRWRRKGGFNLCHPETCQCGSRSRAA